MPFRKEPRRIAGDQRLELGRDFLRGSAKRSEAMLVVGPSGGCIAAHCRKGGRRRRSQQFGVAQG